MPPLIIKLDPARFDPAALVPAVALLRAGGIVAFPTETIYGLGVNLNSAEAVARVKTLRQATENEVISHHIASWEHAEALVRIPRCGAGRRLVRRLWPGPLTLTLPASEGRTMAVRWPHHPVATEFISQAGGVIGAPPASPVDAPWAVTAEDVLRYFPKQIDGIIDAGATQHHQISTVVALGSEGFEIRREGAIPSALIREIGSPQVLFVCSGNTCRSPMAEHLFRRMFARKLGLNESEFESRGIRISSAGLAAMPGTSATEPAITALREAGLDATHHRSKSVTVAMLEEADRIFVMTHSHETSLRELVPFCPHIELLDMDGGDIEDPFGGDAEDYRECARRIRACLERRLADF